MKKRVFYGNPYTGRLSSNRKLIEKDLLEKSNMSAPYTIVQRIHTPSKIHKWIMGVR